ncbi:hypothetical protein CY35_01G094700 [Sphagnum magellanicum]|nr:hypothetical protein CY35_01G094700 [Sphagnum magellanicum]
MAEAGGAFVTRSFEKLLKDAPGRRYAHLHLALKAYLAATMAAATMAEAGNSLQGFEADLVLLPLRLAFETKEPKLVETALDCLHKLISYGHLEGEAGIEGGKNSVTATQIFNMVCASFADDATATDSVVLQLIKVLLTAVASPSFHVHGECLLTAVRTCYNIVLSSKSTVNQATAKATLTQIINIVYKRFELDVERWGAQNLVISETAEVSDLSPNRVSVEELEHLAGHSDIKGFEAALNKVVHSKNSSLKSSQGTDMKLTIGQRDALLVLRTICKMSMKDETDELVIKRKCLSLELLQDLLASISVEVTVNYTFIDSVKAHLCYALLRASVSQSPSVFQLVVNVFGVLLQRFRESLKPEIGVFFSLIVLQSLDNVENPLIHSPPVLKMLEMVCNDAQLLVDIFVNYDCDLEATNLFEHMINSLSRLAQGALSVEPNGLLIAQYGYLKSSSLQCLVSVLQSLEAWTSKEGLVADQADQVPFADEEEEASNGPVTEGANNSEAKDETKVNTQAEDFEKAKAHKLSMETAVVQFNRKPAKGIEFLLAEKLLPPEPQAIAQFLHDTPGLNKKQLGDYLGQIDEFPLAIMHAYVDAMKFKGMKFDHALRLFLNGFRLPGEAQKIDRLMEKFAERYCRDNAGVFGNADMAYVLAYAVIMLNTDAHNPLVWPKMSKTEFLHINLSTGDDNHVPQALLEEIYDSIVKEEIKLKDEDPTLLRKGKPEEKNALLDALNVFNLGRSALQKAEDAAKRESEEIVRQTQALFRKADVKRGVFHKAEHIELARPMLEAVGWPLLAAFSVTMENHDGRFEVLLAMEGVRLGIHLTNALGMQTLHYAFLTSLIRFTSLHSPNEMQAKNVEALKSLLVICQSEPQALQNTWNAVLECISRLEYITSNPIYAATIFQGAYQARSGLILALFELAGKPTEQVFVNSIRLPSDIIVEFFSALCGVSTEELNQIPARVFSLTKLVEISYYNMSRIRMVWAKIWGVVAVLFVEAGIHRDEKIAMYAIDSLRQLAIKYLERAELANFKFQNDILKPFVFIMQSSKSPRTRALIVDCIIQMIKSKVGSIKSGWKSVFMVFTTAAFDDDHHISVIAFENVEQVILEHFDQVLGDCFMDCVSCLIAFASNKSHSSSRTSLKSIALLRICEDRLAEGRIPGGMSRVVDIQKGRDLEVAEFYWFPMLVGLSELTSDPRTEVRNCALEVLFDLLQERGHNFSVPFWDTIFHRILFPMFEHVWHDGKLNGGENVETNAWQRNTCIHSLQLLSDLFTKYFRRVSPLLPALLGLLLGCATQPDQTLASIAIGALVHLTEGGGHHFDIRDWTILLQKIQDACFTIQPSELMDPEFNSKFGSGYESDLKTSGTLTPASDTVQGDRMPIKFHEFSGYKSLEVYNNGDIDGKINENFNYDAQGEIGILDRSMTSSESLGANISPTTTGFFRRVSFTLIGNALMDTLLLKNVNFSRGNQTANAPTLAQASNEDIETGYEETDLDDSEDNNVFLQKLRAKCVIQLLLLSALDSIQARHWQRLQLSHKQLLLNTVLSLVEFCALYNKNSNIHMRMREISGERPPPNLLRLEMEGTKLYLAILLRSSAESEIKEEKQEKWSLGPKSIEMVIREEQKLKVEAERRLVAFYVQILEEVVLLQPKPSVAVPFNTHRSLEMRAPITVLVLVTMGRMETRLFKKHLPLFYPYFTKLISSDQLTIRRALGDLFKAQIMTLLP